MDIWDLGQAVRKTRKAMGLTQQELANRAGVARGRIDGLENERLADIGFVTLSKILEALDMDIRLTTFNGNRPTLDDLQDDNEKEDGYAPGMGGR